MNKAELVAAVAEKAGLSKKDSEKAVNAAFEVISATLAEGGKVIALGMPVNFSSDEFAEGIVKGLTFLSENDAPYMVHCTEGKDRAGFASMLVEALMGANEEEIVRDYMLSYVNYYGVEEGTEKYDMIAQKNIMEMQQSMAKKAESEAKRRAEALMKNQTRQVANEVKQKAKETVKENVGKVKENVGKMTKNKNNKGFSI